MREIEARIDQLKSLETRVKTVLQERAAALATRMCEPLLSSGIVTGLYALGALGVPEGTDWQVRNWMVFLKGDSDRSLGRVLLEPAIENSQEKSFLNAFDFGNLTWKRFIANSARTHVFQETKQHESRLIRKTGDREILLYGVDLAWGKGASSKEMAVYTQLEIDPATRLWAPENFRPSVLVVDSGEGFVREFLLPERGYWDKAEIRAIQGTLQDAMVKAFFRAGQADVSELYYWQLAFSKKCPSCFSNEVTARREREQRGRTAEGRRDDPVYFDCPVRLESPKFPASPKPGQNVAKPEAGEIGKGEIAEEQCVSAPVYPSEEMALMEYQHRQQMQAQAVQMERERMLAGIAEAVDAHGAGFGDPVANTIASELGAGGAYGDGPVSGIASRLGLGGEADALAAIYRHFGFPPGYSGY